MPSGSQRPPTGRRARTSSSRPRSAMRKPRACSRRAGPSIAPICARPRSIELDGGVAMRCPLPRACRWSLGVAHQRIDLPAQIVAEPDAERGDLAGVGLELTRRKTGEFPDLADQMRLIVKAAIDHLIQ